MRSVLSCAFGGALDIGRPTLVALLANFQQLFYFPYNDKTNNKQA